MKKKPRSLFREHGLTIVMVLCFLGFFGGQVWTGFHEHNDEREHREEPPLALAEYVTSAHFVEVTTENWESEFFQMFFYVFVTGFLYQKGSAESKDPDEVHHHSGEQKKVPPDAPWPVRHGGWIARVYEHSLSLAFALLFAVAFCFHLVGGHRLYNQERLAEGERPLGLGEFLRSNRFWFESFQNWQSEFLAIASMVVLSIFLREKNSPESKQVETPVWKNEE